MRFVLAGLIGVAVFGINCGAQAQGSGKACDMACLQQKVEDLEKKLDALTAQVNKSIKSGQNVTLHTQNGRPGGCLTYRGLSGEQGGLVSWNANCSRDVLWTINYSQRRPSSCSLNFCGDNKKIGNGDETAPDPQFRFTVRAIVFD